MKTWIFVTCRWLLSCFLHVFVYTKITICPQLRQQVKTIFISRPWTIISEKSPFPRAMLQHMVPRLHALELPTAPSPACLLFTERNPSVQSNKPHKIGSFGKDFSYHLDFATMSPFNTTRYTHLLEQTLHPYSSQSAFPSHNIRCLQVYLDLKKHTTPNKTQKSNWRTFRTI